MHWGKGMKISNNNIKVENSEIGYFLYEKKIYNKLSPLFEDHIKRGSCVDEAIIKNLSADFSVEQLEMISYLLETEIKVREFGRTSFFSGLLAVFAILTIIFTLLFSGVKGNSDLSVTAIILSPTLLLITNYNYRSLKLYRNTNRLMVYINLAKKYKINSKII